MSDEQHSTELANHLERTVDKRLKSLMDHRRFWSSDDPATALHDLRVASRRLRAFAEAFRGFMGDKLHARVDGPLRRITRAAGAVRDWDVHIGILEGRVACGAADVERAATEHLLERFGFERVIATENAKRRLRKVDLDELELTLRAALSRSITRLPEPAQALRAHVRELLDRLVSEAASHAPPEDFKHGDLEHVESMHRLRIDIKRMRYAFELFEPVFGSHFDLLHERITALQEILGTHHDLVVIGEFLEKEIAALEARKRPTLALGTAALRTSLATEREVAFAVYGAAAFEPRFWLEQVTTSLRDG